MSDLAGQLREALGATYQVERELGGGGMSRVFLVNDGSLGRQIIVKVLAPELAQGVSAERFAREIRIVAQLQHPHIVPVLAAGDLGGLPYYTMPYVSGESARALVKDGRGIPLPRVVQILRDVAKALEFAHQSGVVHRDIKPDNILLTENAAAVGDFGIAKAVVAARTPSQSATLTGLGTAIGTPAYMAPEQALGDADVDHRADIYAFGATAYELLAGHPPFPDRPATAMIRAHISEAPAPIASRRPDTPETLAQLVMRCLEKDPALRPASASALIAVLDGASVVNGRPRRRWRWVAAATVAAMGVAVGGRLALGWGTAVSPSIAVLPFTSPAGDSAAEYFSDGMSEQLVSDLSQVNGLRVASRAVTFAQKGRTEDPRALASRLHVGLLVTGSVRRSGSQLRVEAELMDARSGERLWGDRYDRKLDDVFLVQEEIARAIASALKMSVSVSRPLAQRTDVETYDLYLRGQHLMRTRARSQTAVPRPALDSAIGLFERAIARDWSFAPAWAGLADGYRLLAEHVTPLRVLPRAREAAHRAVQLDPTDLSSGIALANITLNFDWNWEAAEREYRRVLALHPDDPAIHRNLSTFLAAARRYDEALEHVDRAFELERRREPDTLMARAAWLRRVAWLHTLAGRRDEAYGALGQLARIDSSAQTQHTHGWVKLRWEPAAAARHFEVARQAYGNQLPYLSHAGVAYGYAGRPDSTRRIIAELLRRTRTEYVPKDQLFTLYLSLGDSKEALRWLEQGVEERHWWLPYMNGHPMAEPIRNDPAYQRLLARIGVPATAR